MMKPRITLKSVIFITVFIIAQLYCRHVFARPTTAIEAELVVTGWLQSDVQPLGTTIGRWVISVETFTDDDGEPIYFIVYLEPSGLVIVSADDLVEPIIGFADDGIYEPLSGNPLSDFVNSDLRGRITTVRFGQLEKTKVGVMSLTDEQCKWNNLIGLADASEGKVFTMGIRSVSDIRVAPLLKSKWSQLDTCNKPCFNYYTPNNYPCGCVATAMAQIMLYHQYPRTGIGVHDFEIEIDEISHTAYTIGGDGHGGRYSWANMVLVPDCSITETQLQAIGALCYDAGISVNMAYTSEGSSADVLQVKEVLTTIFKYDNSIMGYNDGNNIVSGLIKMVNPNLDAKVPVIIGIYGSNGHAVVVDGYGYNASTLYHHLNMGWGGLDDMWYNMPTVLDFNAVSACVYNIFPQGKGEIVSGRVTDITGKPISESIVTAKKDNVQYNATTNTQGIYALVNVPSWSRLTVNVSRVGYIFSEQTVITGKSRDLSKVSGNIWQVDFVGHIAGDCDGDNDVDTIDFSVFASAWLTEPGDRQWNPFCDISIPSDDFIDTRDLAVFVENWLAGVQ